MPIGYEIDPRAGVVHVTFRGEVTIAEFRAHRAALTSDAQFDPGMHRLTDIRELTGLPSTEELREFASIAGEARRREPPGVQRGVIVGSPTAYGVIRQYQTFLSLAGFSVDILASDDAARSWLATLPAPGQPRTS
jgi:hypothetical protein